MDYKKFRQLIKDKEKSNIDFKIECHAFISRTEFPKAELAKDICAMANNGNKISYILIGVSDDGKKFKSVENPKLTDESIQGFCKTAIFPPPKVKIVSKRWDIGALSVHKGKDFLLIQVGPHSHQAFRLARDFISYKEELCFRRNEVWIRRGTTSDIATPEEVIKLVKGQKLEDSEVNQEIKRDKLEFNQLSQLEKERFVSYATPKTLISLKYKRDKYLSGKIYQSDLMVFPQVYWKTISGVLFQITCSPCVDSFTKSALDNYDVSKMASIDFFTKDQLKVRAAKGILAVRRILLIPVLNSTAPIKISKLFPQWRKFGSGSCFYRPFLFISKNSEKTQEFLPSSSELLIIDSIKSVSYFQEQLYELLVDVEKATDTIMFPK